MSPFKNHGCVLPSAGGILGMEIPSSRRGWRKTSLKRWSSSPRFRCRIYTRTGWGNFTSQEFNFRETCCKHYWGVWLFCFSVFDSGGFLCGKLLVKLSLRLFRVFLIYSDISQTFGGGIYISMLKLKAFAQIYLVNKYIHLVTTKKNLSPLYLHFYPTKHLFSLHCWL